MKRAGLARRLPAALLDGLYLSVAIVIVITVYSVAAGLSLAADVQDAVGVPITWNTATSERLWREVELEAEQMVREITTQFQEDFTEEQAEFIGRTMTREMESYFSPERITFDFILSLDSQVLDRMVNQAFDAVIAADRSDIAADDVNALRDEVVQMINRFELGQLVARVIRFALWLILIPLLVALGYGFIEALSGRTLGKLTLGIRSQRVMDDDPAVPNLMARFAVKYSPLLLLLLGVVTRLPVLFAVAGVAALVVGLGSLAMLGPERRALHDYVAGTAVTTSHASSNQRVAV